MIVVVVVMGIVYGRVRNGDVNVSVPSGRGCDIRREWEMGVCDDSHVFKKKQKLKWKWLNVLSV